MDLASNTVEVTVSFPPGYFQFDSRRKPLYHSPRRSAMPEEVLFKFERQMDRNEIADYLRTVADSLESGGPVSLEAGSESVTMTPPARPTFEIKAERETSSSNPDGPGELGLEFELEWDEGADESDSGDLSIE